MSSADGQARESAPPVKVATAGRVPFSFYSIVMGTAGLGGAWLQASSALGAPRTTGLVLLALAAAIWAVITLSLGWKFAKARARFDAELAHPVQSCFVPLAPATLFLLLPLANAVAPGFALATFWIALVASVLSSAWLIGRWLTERQEIDSVTPAWMFPTVAAGLLGALGAAPLGLTELGWVLFGAGVVAWLMVDSVSMYRLVTREPLPLPLRPLVAVELAPPAIACVAWIGLAGGPGPVGLGLFGYGLLLALVLLRLAKWFAGVPFGPPWWAFTFPAAALSNGALRIGEAMPDALPAALGAPLFLLANLVIGYVALRSLMGLARGRFVPPA